MSDATTVVSNVKYKTYPNGFLDGEELYRASIVSDTTITMGCLFELLTQQGALLRRGLGERLAGSHLIEQLVDQGFLAEGRSF